MVDDRDGDRDGDDDIDAIDTRPSEPPSIGLASGSTGLWGAPPPVFKPSKSSPLEEDDDDEQVPPAALWAMKYRRHLHFGSRDEDVLRVRLGHGNDPVYVLDDGPSHLMICREVGVDDDGLTYYLVGRITLDVYELVADDDAELSRIFSEANDLALCSVYKATGGVSNILVVDSYAGIDEVPAEYLPSNPLIHFTDDARDET